MRLVTIGRVGSPHGVRGWLKFTPLTDQPDRFRKGMRVFLGREGDAPEEYILSDFHYSQQGCRARFEGAESREEAAEFRGLFVRVREEDTPAIEEEDTYYTCQIINMRVVDERGSEWGRVTNIFSTGSNDVYVVTGKGKKEYYLPALKSAVKSVDLKAGLMVIDPEWLT